jgi:hypothetical protein
MRNRSRRNLRDGRYGLLRRRRHRKRWHCSLPRRRPKSNHSTFLARVRKISDCFHALNPYERDQVPESILKIEDDNYIRGTKTQRQLHCLAISAKRYALFVMDEQNNPVLLRKDLNDNDDRWSDMVSDIY